MYGNSRAENFEGSHNTGSKSEAGYREGRLWGMFLVRAFSCSMSHFQFASSLSDSEAFFRIAVVNMITFPTHFYEMIYVSTIYKDLLYSMRVDGTRSKWTVVNNIGKINSTSEYNNTCKIVMNVSRMLE